MTRPSPIARFRASSDLARGIESTRPPFPRLRLRRGCSVDNQSEVGFSTLREVSIHGEIFLRHPAGGEPLLELAAYFFTGQLRKTIDSPDGSFFVLDDEAGQPVVDHFRHRAPI